MTHGPIGIGCHYGGVNWLALHSGLSVGYAVKDLVTIRAINTGAIMHANKNAIWGVVAALAAAVMIYLVIVFVRGTVETRLTSTEITSTEYADLEALVASSPDMVTDVAQQLSTGPITVGQYRAWVSQAFAGREHEELIRRKNSLLEAVSKSKK